MSFTSPEFWIALSWKIDPDGSLGIRQYFESPLRPGQPITMDEYYGWIFEHSVPGLPEAAAKEGLTPLAYMRKYGVFKVSDKTYSRAFERPLAASELAGTVVEPATETISVQWFATAGRFAESVTWPLYTKTLDTAYTAPDEAKSVRLWMVARDQRGGTTWREIAVEITD